MAYKKDIRRVLSSKKKTPPSDARSKNPGNKAGYGFSEYTKERGQYVPSIRYRPGKPGPPYPLPGQRPRKARKPDSYQRS